MPKAATYTLIWSHERACYELHEHGNNAPLLTAGDETAWQAWLEAHSGFAFAGRAGRINLRKEARKGGAGYWYAYRRHGRRTLKRYLGRSAELTPERLEAAAAALASAHEPAQTFVGDTFVPQPSSDPPPLLTPKLQLPRLPGGLVARERLLAQLDAGLERKLTLLVAPAGFGKTTLVRQWIATRTEDRGLRTEWGDQRLSPQSSILSSHVGWVALDEGDN